MVSQHERPGRHLSVLAKPPSGPIRDCVCAHQKGPAGIDAAFSSGEIMSMLVGGTSPIGPWRAPMCVPANVASSTAMSSMM